jgi:hypothetical protein
MGGIEMSDHIPDPTKMIQDTPRTDAAYFKPAATMYDLAGDMKRIERELNAANERIKRLDEENLRLKDRIKRLVKVGDYLDACVSPVRENRTVKQLWLKAKEAKL